MTSTINGASPASPFRDPAALSTKRKHDDITTTTDAIVNGENTANDRNESKHIQQSLRDIWAQLSAQDISPTILHRISLHQIPNDSLDDQPSIKRAKLSPASPPSDTIASKIAHGHYASYDAFLADFGNASSDILKHGMNTSMEQAPSVDLLEHEHLQASLSATSKVLINLVNSAKQKVKSQTNTESHSPKQEHGLVSLVNGTGDGVIESPLPQPGTEPLPRAVLTLFGNAQGHKQLFSSFQKAPARPKSAKDSPTAKLAPHTGAIPLHEGNLPIGLSSTKVIPMPKDVMAKNGRTRRTIQELFPPTASVRPLAPPKTPKLVTSRDSPITWNKASAPGPNPRSTGYADEKLATGSWLGYSGLAPAEEPSSPQAKRKQRDRALSTGEATLAPSRIAKAAQLQAEEEALFRGAYSSFAPSRDNSTALIPEETRNELWWERYGNFYNQQESAIDPSFEAQEDGNYSEIEFQDKETLFREAVDQFVPGTLAPTKIVDNSEDKEAEEMLLEISQMLETLHSYQRIRMSSLSAGSRSSLVQNSSLQDLTGNPSTPSTAEYETYKTLKTQLALIVSLLPPYAVAKLNGDQLADLSISRNVPIETEEYRGVMEEDKASRDAKQAAFQAAVGVATTNNRQTPVHPAVQHQVRGQQMSQSARGHNQSPMPHVSSPQTMPRGQPQFSRQPLSSWQKPSQNYIANTQRPSYVKPQTYDNPQISRSSSQNMRHSYPQLTPQMTPQMMQPRPGNMQHMPNGSYQAPQQLNYQQRPQNHAPPLVNAPNGSYAMSPSPSKGIPRNYPPQMSQHNQNQHYHSQQPFASRASPSQQGPHVPPSPREQIPSGSLNQDNASQSSQPTTRPQAPSVSSVPQPSSSTRPTSTNSGTPDLVNTSPAPPEPANASPANATTLATVSANENLNGSATVVATEPTAQVTTEPAKKEGNADPEGVAMEDKSPSSLSVQQQPQAPPVTQVTPISQQ